MKGCELEFGAYFSVVVSCMGMANGFIFVLVCVTAFLNYETWLILYALQRILLFLAFFNLKELSKASDLKMKFKNMVVYFVVTKTKKR